MRFFIITCLLGLFAPAFTAMALGVDELPVAADRKLTHLRGMC